MKYALTMFPTDYAIRPDELARAAEERGFDALSSRSIRTFPLRAGRRTRPAATCPRNTRTRTTHSSRWPRLRR